MNDGWFELVGNKLPTLRDYNVIKPTCGKSFWFRYGDIKHLTPKQVEGLIGPLAKSGVPGGAKVMHVATSPVGPVTKVPGGIWADFSEYLLTKPISPSSAFTVQP